MAQKKKPAARAASAASAGRGKTKAAPAHKPSGAPHRREVGGAVCLLLGLIASLGLFVEGYWLVDGLCIYALKGLVGAGFYLFPVSMLLCALTLFFHHGRPVGLRVTASLLLPLLLGCLQQLLFSRAPEGAELIRQLYLSGQTMTSGGVISGLAAMGMESAISVYGAVPLLILLLLASLMLSVNLTPSRIRAYFRAHPRPAYIPEPEPEPDPESLPLRPVHTRTGRRRAAIDIPLAGEEEERTRTKAGFFNATPNVRTPDQLLDAPVSPGPEPQPAPAPAGNKTVTPVPVRRSEPESVEFTVVERQTPEPEPEEAPPAVTAAVPMRPATAAEKAAAREDVARETAEITRAIEEELAEEPETYEFPPLELLNAGRGTVTDAREELAQNQERLDAALRSFGVSGRIIGVTRGPTITRYDLELEAGVKLSKLTGLTGDLALSLGVTSVRVAPIPDKISTVGIEVPNRMVSTVYLRDIIGAGAFTAAQSKLTFAIGKDISGAAIVGNIAKLPHMLIAGTTGSGKSVCMNSLILSLLYKAEPEEVRLIMIDPKMVELGIYNGIPHLFIPVVTDPKKAAGALQWAVVEMMHRYRLFSEAGVRDLTAYNKRQRTLGEAIMPQVVIVIDELADLMLVASKEVEESICRVAQMGRASGMHLIIATQRPSADVITGLMKANIPSRIAFAVSSAMESRIILDSAGAEKLIGSGDMLYSPIGVGKPVRIQGAFVSDEEREQVINFIKARSESRYSEEVMAEVERAAAAKDKQNGKPAPEEDLPAASRADFDELLPQGVEVIFDTQQASVSMIQRRLKLGYARAARMIDQMEELGIVGPFEGSKPRKLLITRDQWRQMQYSEGTAPADIPLPMEELPDEEEADDLPWMEEDEEIED